MPQNCKSGNIILFSYNLFIGGRWYNLYGRVPLVRLIHPYPPLLRTTIRDSPTATKTTIGEWRGAAARWPWNANPRARRTFNINSQQTVIKQLIRTGVSPLFFFCLYGHTFVPFWRTQHSTILYRLPLLNVSTNAGTKCPRPSSDHWPVSERYPYGYGVRSAWVSRTCPSLLICAYQLTWGSM